VCVRGASALDEMMATLPEARVRLFVVWEPVIRTDIAPPTSSVMGKLRDTRAAQFWDPKRLVSDALIGTARAHLERLPPGDEVPSVIWDAVLIYGPEARWDERIPFPAYYGGPVESVMDEAKRALSAELP
jgi:hypothetical protein